MVEGVQQGPVLVGTFSSSTSCSLPCACPASFAQKAHGAVGFRISAMHVVCHCCRYRHTVRRFSRIFAIASTLCCPDTHQSSPSAIMRPLYARGLAQREELTVG